MLHPVELNNLAKIRQQEMLAAAAAYRRSRQAGNKSPKRFGQFLVSLGQRIKGEPAVEVRPALNTK